MKSTPTLGCHWRVRTALGALWALAMSLVPGAAALAHGEITGMQDVVQDYGVLLFLVATILIGAGVLAWVTFSPQADEADEAQGADEADGGDEAAVARPAEPSGVADVGERARDAVAGRQ